jgi:prepilin-type N-terminal cleavage/methylation domain-containing protein
MNPKPKESGFTLVELLVTMGIFALVSVGFYSLLFASQRGAGTSQDVNEISQEARLGLNRMIRDTREAGTLTDVTATGYTVEIDFDGDGVIEASEFEVVVFAYDAGGSRLTIGNGTTTETLIGGVSPISGVAMFTYDSNRLEYDANNDGKTTVAELDAAQASGATLTTDKSAYLSNVSYAFRISKGDSVASFYSQAQLRNRR